MSGLSRWRGRIQQIEINQAGGKSFPHIEESGFLFYKNKEDVLCQSNKQRDGHSLGSLPQSMGSIPHGKGSMGRRRNRAVKVKVFCVCLLGWRDSRKSRKKCTQNTDVYSVRASVCKALQRLAPV